MVKKHEWHVLMLGPEDVDELAELGLHDDQIESLRLFHIKRIKDRGLDAVLADVERAFHYKARKTAAGNNMPLVKKNLSIETHSEEEENSDDLYAATSDAAERALISPPLAPLKAAAGGSVALGDGDVGSSLQSTPRIKLGSLPDGPLVIRRHLEQCKGSGTQELVR